MDIDLFVARNIYEFNKATNNAFTPLLKAITVSANLGIIFIVISLMFLIFKKSRRIGVEILVSLLIGTIIVNILKFIVVRPRPFIDTNSAYYTFYTFAGSLKQGGYSFPSGHTCAAASFGVMLFIKLNKKYSFIFLLIPLLFGFTRIYFNVHYFSDVVVGCIIGILSTILTIYLSKYVVNKYISRNNIE